MRILPAGLCAFLSLLIAACSDHSNSDREGESSPPSHAAKEPDGPAARESEKPEVTPGPDQIGEDCVAFLRATKVAQPEGENKDCPECPGENAAFEVLKFNGFRIEKISPSEAGCEVTVEIRAEFNPSPGGNIVGGLTGWIPLEQREQYAKGQTPAGEQIYQVRVIYRRTGGFWQAIEFDRGGKG